MNMHDIICKAGDRLAEMSIDPRKCAGFFVYEPELSSEIINEMAND
ncbi:MAG: hypothetical protein FWE20_11940 [Defluviitaleaceae bacterium]|nr:hypothetical protein [Defluviitaleaceae bacterium]